MVLDISKDGITHINMYSKANTEFGRMLSDFYRCPIDTMHDGSFLSIEGYWYWLSLPCEFKARDQLRSLYGFMAKSKGRELRNECVRQGYQLQFEPLFEQKILTAIDQKLQKNLHLFRPEYKDLPIYHYYIINGKVKDVTENFPWLIKGIRKLIKEIYERKTT